MVRSGATFADAAAEWLRFVEHDRERKPSTVADYRSVLESRLLPAFGQTPIEEITSASIERWRASLEGLSNRSKNKLLIAMHGIFRRAQTVYGLSVNPLACVEKHPQKRSGNIEVFSPEEVWAVVRAAASDQDGAMFLTAAFTGLRLGELLALRWRDVDFTGATIRVRASYAAGQLTVPKSGKVRAVPMAPDVASALAQLSRREHWLGDDDLVFVGDIGHVDGSALRRRYKAAFKRAGLRPLHFHDLRHTFGTRMIANADIRRVQEWMGHADVQTTMKYLHYAPRAQDARMRGISARDEPLGLIHFFPLRCPSRVATAIERRLASGYSRLPAVALAHCAIAEARTAACRKRTSGISPRRSRALTPAGVQSDRCRAATGRRMRRSRVSRTPPVVRRRKGSGARRHRGC